MDKFINHEGEQPIWLGDIDFMNESVRNAIKMLLQGITGLENPTCILQGCELTSNGVTAGVICLNGEVLPVEASTEDGTLCHFEVQQSLGGERLTKENKPVSCYQYRKVIVVPGVGESSDIATMPRLGHYLRNDSSVLFKASSYDSPDQYRVDVYNGRYILTGYLYTYDPEVNTDSWTSVAVVDLPTGAGYAPVGGWAYSELNDSTTRGEEIPMRLTFRQKNPRVVEMTIWKWGPIQPNTQYNFTIPM